MNALELMQAQVRVLYTLDGQERLRLCADLTVPENEWEAAPRFFLGRTAMGNVWYFRHDLPGDLVLELDALCRQDSVNTDQIRALLNGGEDWGGPAYLVPKQTEPGQALEITPDNAELLEAYFPNTARRTREGRTGPVTAMIQDGQAVAVCSCVRLNAQSAEAGVHTLEAWRGHGYATQITALWANLLHAQGILPLYSTNWENTASQGVARKLSAQQFGEDWSIR